MLQLYNDFISSPSSPFFANLPSAESIKAIPYAASLTDKVLEKSFITFAKSAYQSKVNPSLLCAKRCGNMYTASLYGGLASLLSSISPEELKGKRISMFAYGSGLASSFFVIRVKGDTTEMREKLDLVKRLASIKVVPCQEYVEALKVCNTLPCLISTFTDGLYYH